MSGGSIYRNEGGVAVPYANLSTGGETGEKTHTDVKSLYTSSVSGITISGVEEKTCGDITILIFDLSIAANTSIPQGNNTILTLGSYTSHKDLTPFYGGEILDVIFTQSYLPIAAPCACRLTLLYNGGIDMTMQSGGHVFSAACSMQMRVMFINNT